MMPAGLRGGAVSRISGAGEATADLGVLLGPEAPPTDAEAVS